MSTDGGKTLDEIAETVRATKEYEAKLFGVDDLDYGTDIIPRLDEGGRPLESLEVMLLKSDACTEPENYEGQYKELLRNIEETLETIRQLCLKPSEHMAKIITTFNEIHIKPFNHYKEETEPQEEDKE